MSGKYDDILFLPHPVSTECRHMSNLERAAQFAPFAALTGYESAVLETARLTEAKAELDESEKAVIDTRLRMLLELPGQQPEIIITYFVPDKRKSGGSYVETTGYVKRIDLVEKIILLTDGTRIPIEDVFSLEGELLAQIED
ncbi:MAG: hypothetical protein ACI3VN_08485 [Candidatus Onthomonas sp.]